MSYTLASVDFFIFFFAFLFLFSILAIIAAVLMIKHNVKIRKYISENTEMAFLEDKYQEYKKYYLKIRLRNGEIKTLIVKKFCFLHVVPFNEILVAILNEKLLFYEQKIVIPEDLETDENLL